LIFAIIPIKRFENSKSRLASLFSLQERVTLSGFMLDDTLATLATSRCFDKILVVTGDSRAKQIADSRGAVVVWQESDTGVNSAVALGDAYSAKAGVHATVVVPQDLPLMSSQDVAGVCDLASSSPCVAVCPSLRFDGTNVLLRSPPMAITTHYDNNSYESHLNAAATAGLPVKVIDSKNLMFDLDTPNDIGDLIKISDGLIYAKSSVSFIKSLISDRSM
jgi:2-phospho-L-lactate/phosphoenolpyruvate guanylyltransferase